MNAPFLEWVPFEEFEDIEKIGQGGFSKIYKATWKVTKETNNGTGIIERSKEKHEIVLKILNNSQNMDTEFLNEVIIIILLLNV